MKIRDIEVIRFRTRTRQHPSKWGYGFWGKETESSQSITRISTDEGIDGYMLGGTRHYIKGPVKRMLLGEDPLEREKLWNWIQSPYPRNRSPIWMGVAVTWF